MLTFFYFSFIFLIQDSFYIIMINYINLYILFE